MTWLLFVPAAMLMLILIRGQAAAAVDAHRRRLDPHAGWARWTVDGEHVLVWDPALERELLGDYDAPCIDGGVPRDAAGYVMAAMAKGRVDRAPEAIQVVRDIPGLGGETEQAVVWVERRDYEDRLCKVTEAGMNDGFHASIPPWAEYVASQRDRITAALPPGSAVPIVDPDVIEAWKAEQDVRTAASRPSAPVDAMVVARAQDRLGRALRRMVRSTTPTDAMMRELHRALDGVAEHEGRYQAETLARRMLLDLEDLERMDMDKRAYTLARWSW